MADLAPPLQPSTRTIGAWHNFTVWTAQQFRYTVNVTRYAPSIEDLVWAGPRMVRKLGSFISFPDAIDGLGQRFIPDATSPGIFQSDAGATMSQTAASRASSSQPLQPDQDPSALVVKFSMDGARGLGSVFSYATSKWALCCIAMAIILNRATIFATTRRRLRLPWYARFLVRGVPIILFVIQAVQLLQSIQCQTSPDFAELRWGDASKNSDLMFSQTNGFLHGVSSALLLRPSDHESCRAVNMIPKDKSAQSQELRGSLSLLWPLFGTFCLSHFLETISCAVQRRPLAAETGMTLFEHSLAFAEADAAISNQLGWGLFANTKNADQATGLGANIAISRSMILRRVNTPPEVLLVAFLSTMSHITSHILGVFNVQAKYRLVSTGFWGLCFMGSILWSAFIFSLENPSEQGLLRFPTVCIIGFIPHVLVLAGILVCLSIYLLAVLLSALAPPTGQASRNFGFRERLQYAQSNMQANVSWSDLRITREMDFYTALLRTGFGAITLASEAVYLNEDRDVNLKQRTWLEEQRIQEFMENRIQLAGTSVADTRYDNIGTIGLIPVQDNAHMPVSNGYTRERAAQKIPKARTGVDKRLRDGVGAAERSGRWLMALEFIMNINRVLLKAWAVVILKMLAKIGIHSRPRWLLWLIKEPKHGRDETRTAGSQNQAAQSTDGFLGTIAGIRIPRGDLVDVEAEVRRRLQSDRHRFVDIDEAELDTRLYNWWLKGGLWGSSDMSSDYCPVDEDDNLDNTSVVSFSTTDGNSGDWESEEEGQRTPTQQFESASRAESPFVDSPMQMDDLARLLHPRSPEEREEAHALAAHLASDRIMTRSHYKQVQRLQRTQVLTSGRPGHLHGRVVARAKLSSEEEAQLLEQILLSKRRQPEVEDGAPGDPSSSWSTGAAGLGPDGPQCVVCQSAARTIIVWPCRCLSLCDDCRVSLAMNNFDKCVCCRREVSSFSRIYVP